MAKPLYLEQLGTALGFAVLPNARTFKNDYQQGKGIVLGLREGYLVCVGLISAGDARSVGVLVRYRRGSPKEVIENALKALPTFKTFAARKPLNVSDDGLAASWLYAIKKPAPDVVLAFVDEILSCLRGLALPFSGKCEDCGSSDVGDVTLVNGIPGYHCGVCQARFAAEKERAAEEYRNRPANYVLGVPVGALTAAAAGTLWGLFISWAEVGSRTWEPKLHAIMGFAIGGVAAWMLFKTMGKVTRAGQAIAILLTIAGKFWGDLLFYTFSLLNARNAHVSVNPLNWTQHDYHTFTAFLSYVLHRFWELKLYGFHGKMILAGDLMCAFCLPWLPWGKIPKFAPTFEKVGRIPESSRKRLAAATS